MSLKQRHFSAYRYQKNWGKTDVSQHKTAAAFFRNTDLAGGSQAALAKKTAGF
jgi:hypothetical protein